MKEYIDDLMDGWIGVGTRTGVAFSEHMCNSLDVMKAAMFRTV